MLTQPCLHILAVLVELAATEDVRTSTRVFARHLRPAARLARTMLTAEVHEHRRFHRFSSGFRFPK